MVILQRLLVIAGLALALFTPYTFGQSKAAARGTAPAPRSAPPAQTRQQRPNSTGGYWQTSRPPRIPNSVPRPNLVPRPYSQPQSNQRGGYRPYYNPYPNAGRGTASVPYAGLVGKVTPGGGRSYTSQDTVWETNRQGRLTSYSSPNLAASFRDDGRLVHAQAVMSTNAVVTINRTASGHRLITSQQPDGSRIVSLGPRIGYLETARRGGFVQRTYLIGNTFYSGRYQFLNYAGVYYYRYVPVAYYEPSFYIWASTASLAWMTNQILAENSMLVARSEDSYSNAGANPQYQSSWGMPYGAGNPNQITDASKQEMSEEIGQQLQLRANLAGTEDSLNSVMPPVSNIPPVLKLDIPVLPLVKSLDVYVGNQPCSLNPPDMIRINSGELINGSKVQALVDNSAPGDCPAGSIIEIELPDAEEMYDHISQQIESFTGVLAQSQGKTPIPNGQAPSPDAVRKSLSVQRQDATTAENQAVQAAGN